MGHPDAAPQWCSEGEMPTATALLLATELRAASGHADKESLTARGVTWP
jgi:hypothetical protein